jgi:hypothetical protein
MTTRAAPACAATAGAVSLIPIYKSSTAMIVRMVLR